MKTLVICPSFRPAVPHLAKAGPLATAPIFGDCVAGLWIEHLASLGAREILIVAADGGDSVSAAVGNGARWGVRISVITPSSEPTREEAEGRYRPQAEQGWLAAPHDIVPMSHLPGCPKQLLFESYSSWFAALVAWMPLALTPARIRVKETRPGVWIGSRARVSPLAQLNAPCWVGDQATVEAGAVVGPDAILEDRSVVGGESLVARSWVGPDTCVGPMTSVANSLAWGSTLIDWRTDSLLQVPDSFLLGSLAKPQSAATTDRFGRALAPRSSPEPRAPLIPAYSAGARCTPNSKPPG